MHAWRLLGLFLLLAGSACQTGRPARLDGWRSVDTGCGQSLRGLAAVDAEVAFVGGAGGTLLKTVDGGTTWTNVAPARTEGCDFRDVEAFDRSNVVAMVAGQPARIYRTADGGASWRIVHEDPRPQAFFDSVAFGRELGVLFGDAIDGHFTILISQDQGRTWREARAREQPVPREGEAGFAASGTCAVATLADPDSFAFVTGGGPCRFFPLALRGVGVASDLPMQKGTASQGAFSSAWSGLRGVVVGGDYRQPQVAKGTVAVTFDGGRRWFPGNACGFRSAVIWIDDRALLAVGSHGASWSADEGRTWTAFGDAGYHSLSKGVDGSVWACGSDGRVARLRLSRSGLQ